MKKRKLKYAAALTVLIVLLCVASLSGCGLSEEESADYEEVLALALEEFGEKNWVHTGQSRSWGSETPNYHDQYNFYIDEELYDEYKHYWLEDVPENKYKEGLNQDLWQSGDYAQHCINIYKLNYSNDIDYSGVTVKKETDYYRVSVYDKALYYKYIYGFKDSQNFFTESDFRVDDDSLIAEMLYHKEGKDWVMEKVNRDN